MWLWRMYEEEEEEAQDTTTYGVRCSLSWPAQDGLLGTLDIPSASHLILD